MTYLDLCKMIEGKEYSENVIKKMPVRELTKQDLDSFKLLLTMDARYQYGFKQTESAKEFYTAFELLRIMIPKEIQSEVFYAAKVGYFIQGIPSQLIYLLKKATRVYDTPNRALSMIDCKLLSPFLVKGVLQDGVTVLDILEDVLGRRVELMSEYKRCVRNNGAIEVYVENADRVLVLPTRMEGYVRTLNDIKTVQYDKGKGVTVHGQLLRTMDGRIGLTTDEFDLRECI